MTELIEESDKIGLAMNTSKSKLMTNIKAQEVLVGGKEIEMVKEYSYQRQMLALENRGSLQPRSRTAKAWRNFWAHREILKGSLPIRTKIKILDQCVVPHSPMELKHDLCQRHNLKG